jgi:hypothetical protein
VSARFMYKKSCEELSELCYQIQQTGSLPDPGLLTNAILQFRQARALVQTLDGRADAVGRSRTLQSAAAALLEQFSTSRRP